MLNLLKTGALWLGTVVLALSFLFIGWGKFTDPGWVEVATTTLIDGTNSVADADSTNYPHRSYCVTPP